ncbi:XkdW family protein [Aquipseudomonas alcaligenes]|uniref:XkdW family protein n=1 Tax=Aquipseudomonas alcaligenes TaxID=43263 RepID=A0AA42N3R6_AQUAC|nr:XkdW family protein [Pseudomonas alcaligenes]MDH1055581.1 XkdW family protein [Pseudomonas alcaligenes]
MLYDAIKQLFPKAVAGTDFLLRDDGEGPFIAQWNLAEPKPTAAALAAAGKTVLLKQLCASIDAIADEARKAVAGDALRAVEYEKAAVEAQTFKEAGYPVGAVPRTVAAWAINGRTAQQAADNILAEAAAYSEALYQIREARLGAKEQVRQAMAANQVEQARLIASATIESIRAAITGIGNAGA